MRTALTFLFLKLTLVSLSQSYTVAQVPFAPLSTNGTLVNFVDDDVTGAIPIGFKFCFWGNEYANAYIGSNGWVGFYAGQPFAFTPFVLPTTNPFIPKNCIMGPFHDMNPGIAGANPPTLIQYVYYRTEGVAPFRRFVVSWVNVPMYQCIALRSQQQIVLYESTNLIENTIFFKAVCASWVNGRAIHGLHDAGGANAVTVAGRNATVWAVPAFAPETWQFVPVECCPFDGETNGQ